MVPTEKTNRTKNVMRTQNVGAHPARLSVHPARALRESLDFVVLAIAHRKVGSYKK